MIKYYVDREYRDIHGVWKSYNIPINKVFKLFYEAQDECNRLNYCTVIKFALGYERYVVKEV